MKYRSTLTSGAGDLAESGHEYGFVILPEALIYSRKRALPYCRRFKKIGSFLDDGQNDLQSALRMGSCLVSSLEDTKWRLYLSLA